MKGFLIQKAQAFVTSADSQTLSLPAIDPQEANYDSYNRAASVTNRV